MKDNKMSIDNLLNKRCIIQESNIYDEFEVLFNKDRLEEDSEDKYSRAGILLTKRIFINYERNNVEQLLKKILEEIKEKKGEL